MSRLWFAQEFERTNSCAVCVLSRKISALTSFDFRQGKYMMRQAKSSPYLHKILHVLGINLQSQCLLRVRPIQLWLVNTAVVFFDVPSSFHFIFNIAIHFQWLQLYRGVTMYVHVGRHICSSTANQTKITSENI